LENKNSEGSRQLQIDFECSDISVPEKIPTARQFRMDTLGDIKTGGNKTNLSRPLAISKGLGIPAYVVFDGDCDKATGREKTKHETDNQCILNLCNEDADPLPDSAYFSESLVMWYTRIHDEIKKEIGAEKWNDAELRAKQEHALSDGVRHKNPLLISATLENLWEEGIKSNLLDEIISGIIEHARKVAKE